MASFASCGFAYLPACPQIIQLFDSWAHHLSPAQFAEFSLPYANR
jgi:uroporphyrinogen-III decarboxylase